MSFDITSKGNKRLQIKLITPTINKTSIFQNKYCAGVFFIGVAGADLWDIFMAYVQRFEWSETKDGTTKKDDSTKSKSKSKEQKGGSNKQYIPIGIENMQDGDRHVVLTCNGFVELIIIVVICPNG